MYQNKSAIYIPKLFDRYDGVTIFFISAIFSSFSFLDLAYIFFHGNLALCI